MEYLYIDESGSMTKKHAQYNPFFVIALVRAHNPDKIRRLHKRFVHKYFDSLRALDDGEHMFRNDRFHELKGSKFTPSLKSSFVSYFCRNNNFEVYYIVVDNKKISGTLYDNTARAFNYFLKLALECFIKRSILTDDTYVIQLDERNERTDTKHFLQNYLNTELRMNGTLSTDVQVLYFDSAQNRIIQIADVLANLYYSHLLTGNYKKEIDYMQEAGCLKFIFQFPL